MNENLGQTNICSLAEATKDDIELICAYDRICLDGLPGRVVADLELLRGEHGGMSVDRLDALPPDGHESRAPVSPVNTSSALSCTTSETRWRAITMRSSPPRSSDHS